MKTQIKRLAQFLFDNAEMIQRELRNSSHYRSLSIDLQVFKYDKAELSSRLSLYDEKTTHYYLHDDAICIKRFRQICEQLNSESGFNPLPTPVKVREKL